jgi:protein gp37
MSTAIQWCHVPGYAADVWNPTTGCTSNGTGCDLCYARTLTNMRHKAYKAGKLQKFPHYAHPFSVVQMHPGRLANPLKVKRPTCYFVNSMSDLFHEDVPFDFIDKVFAVMAMCPQHIFIILTKRPERMAEYTAELIHGGRTVGKRLSELVDGRPEREARLTAYCAGARKKPLPNVWMGASASTQAEVDAAMTHVFKTNAAVKLLSLEPLVEAVTLSPYGHRVGGSKSYVRGVIDWVIVGGESGTTKQKPRPMHPDWARQVRDECKAAGVPYFFKQWGGWLPHPDENILKGFELEPDPKDNLLWLDGEGRSVAALHPDGDYKVAGGFETGEVAMVRAGKTANGHLLDGKEEFAWPIVKADETVASR